MFPVHHQKFSIFSHSLGDNSVYDLPQKLKAAALVGFKAVEISTADLEQHANSGKCSLLAAAKDIGALCGRLCLKVICLQPVRNIAESSQFESDFNKAVLPLFDVMDALDTQLMLCCSSDLGPPAITPEFSTVVNNLRSLGVKAASHRHRLPSFPSKKKYIAFEALCWGTYISTWRQAWKVVKEVNLDNVGICLDSFNTLAREWADPTVPGGIQPDADFRLAESLDELSRVVPGRKIFLLQLGDGKKLSTPINPLPSQPSLRTWSRSSRLFPMEQDLGGYLPVQSFVKAVLKTGYQGYWSVEVFNSSLAKLPNSPHDAADGHLIRFGPEPHALRGLEGLNRLYDYLYFNFNHSLVLGSEVAFEDENALLVVKAAPPATPPARLDGDIATKFSITNITPKDFQPAHRSPYSSAIMLESDKLTKIPFSVTSETLS